MSVCVSCITIITNKTVNFSLQVNFRSQSTSLEIPCQLGDAFCLAEQEAQWGKGKKLDL